MRELYADYREMLDRSRLDAVHLVSSSSVHSGQTIEALGRGLHVFCEKPMGIDVGECLAVLSVSRTAFRGHDTHTEITGSKGILKMGLTPSKDRVELFNAAGARADCVKDIYERFAEGFLAEAQELVDCALEGRKPSVSALDGRKAVEVGYALTESFRSGKAVTLGSG